MVDSFRGNSLYPVVTAVLLLSVTSCNVGKKYQRPNLADIEKNGRSWQLAEGNQVLRVVPDAVAGNWWQSLQDPQLNWLLAWAMYGNHDLKSAAARLLEAQANADASYSALLPEVNGTASAAHRALAAPLDDETEDVAQAGINGTWDLDLFGGNRQRRRAASANVEATAALQQQVYLDLSAEVARAYIQYRTAQHQKNLVLQNLGLQQETLKATLAQRQAGAISDFEVTRGQAQVNTTAAQLPQIERSAHAAINRLSVLTTLQPVELLTQLAPLAPIPVLPTVTVVSTPLNVISRRPDIQAAERRLAQTLALRNAAFAGYFPRVSLDAFWAVGHSSQSGNFLPWGATLNGLLPLLNFGAIEAQVDAADARHMQAYHTFQQTVLLALENVENSLTAYLTELQRKDILEEVMKSQAQAAIIARAQYEAGATTQLDLLVSERNKLDAENAYVQSAAAVAENMVLLYRALGEAWQQNPQVQTMATQPQSVAPSVSSQPAVVENATGTIEIQ
ncbi:MAG TPA: efflux transporter outer membrane subunit [Alphaproteobacteria bacterium]|nr:hypothetical protein [Rhodospirillaceae bacterium]HRJ11871.1 efflux transporter outer membrane subunit [Alphaproteobacteria bacterium]